MTRLTVATLLAFAVLNSTFAAADELPQIRLHLEANTPSAKLQRRARLMQTYGDTDVPVVWQSVCAAPCEKAVDRAGIYRIGGDGLIPSEAIALPPGDRVDIHAQTSAVSKRTAGVLLAALGSAALVSGAVAAEVGLAMPAPSITGYQPDTGWLIAAVALAAAGIAGLAVGLPLLFTSHTRVEVLGSDVQDLAVK